MKRKIHLLVFLFSLSIFIFSLVGSFYAQMVYAKFGSSSSSGLFGWAWGATNEANDFGVGWIRLNSCDDVAPFDGLPDLGCVPTYSVLVKDSSGELSGYAWSNNLGWLSFNRSETGNPPSDDPGGGSGMIAKIQLNGANTGTFTGWGRFLAATSSGQWDGWVHLADNSEKSCSSAPCHPSGPLYIDGKKGVTYNPASGSVVGYAWGSLNVGWIKFVNATYRSPSSGTFTYNLENSGPITISPGGASGTVRITRNLISGTPQPVTITSSIIPLASGVTTSVSPTNNPCTPSSTCFSDITFTAAAGAANQTYTVTVTGDIITGGSGFTTTFQVVVAPSSPNPTLSVSCILQSQPPFYVNRPIKWIGTVANGISPYTVRWTLSNSPSNNIIVDETAGGPEFSTIQTYAKVGQKTATFLVTDSTPAPPLGDGPLTGTCSLLVPISVDVSPNILEK